MTVGGLNDGGRVSADEISLALFFFLDLCVLTTDTLGVSECAQIDSSLGGLRCVGRGGLRGTTEVKQETRSESDSGSIFWIQSLMQHNFNLFFFNG